MTEHEQLFLTKYDLLFESRLTRVETTMENIDQHIKEVKSDLRWIFGIFMGVNVMILSLLAKGFHWFT